MEKKDYNQIVFREDLENQFKTFLNENERQDKDLIKQLTYDAVRCYILYGITPDEYFMHDLAHQSEDYKKSILSRKYKDELSIRSYRGDFHLFLEQLRDKWEFYLIAKPYFHRAVCRVQEEADYAAFAEFCKTNTRFIAKPRNASCGIGVHIVDLQDSKWSGIRSVFEHYINLEGEWLFEELIIQDEAMSQWHPSSVNTIRIPSVLTKDGPKIILPLFRTGKGGNLVDNCHNDGGLMSVPDTATGRIVSDGYDIYTNIVENHPDSGMKFKGWQVPKWDELVRISGELHSKYLSDHKYVGFDFALTPKGWVVVEGNWGNFPHQVCVHQGIKREFRKLMNE